MYVPICLWEPVTVYQFQNNEYCCFGRTNKQIECGELEKKVKNIPCFLRVLPISAPQILKKTGLTLQAHELIDEFPHFISTGNYKLMCL